MAIRNPSSSSTLSSTLSTKLTTKARHGVARAFRRAGSFLCACADAVPRFARARSARATFLAGSLCAASVLCGADGPFTADLSQGSIDIQIRAEPAQARADRDLVVTVRVSSPDYLKVTLPDLRARFRGFKVAESFNRDPESAGGVTRIEQRWRLVPDLLRVYRLAPFAVSVADTRTTPNRTTSFATRPVIFPSEPAPATVSGSPEVSPRPFWIRPTPRTVLGWIGLAILLLLAAVLAFRGLQALQRQVRERRLSPRERAFAELDRLLRRNLPGKRLYKEFFIELTMVVRRYIERTHDIHAPEQTTQEFLAAAARHPRFTPDVLARLRVFLESADLVKFAGQEATPRLADDAVVSARNYLDTDSNPSSSSTSSSTLSSTSSTTQCSTSDHS